MESLVRREAPWVPDELKTLERMLSNHVSMDKMMRELQRTRASIASKRGKLQRVGGRSDLSAKITRGGVVGAKVGGTWTADDRPLARLEATAPPPGAVCIPLLALEAHHCRFPVGTGHAVFCGATRADKDTPYCRFHHTIAYRVTL